MLDLKNAKSVPDRFIRLSSICFLLSSCSGPRQDDNLMENKNLYSIDLDHSTKERSFVFSSIFCDLETIILDSEEKVIGNIDKIQADDSTIYILDINISKGVFKYSRNGKLYSANRKHRFRSWRIHKTLRFHLGSEKQNHLYSRRAKTTDQ